MSNVFLADLILTGVFGSLFGSFLNVVVYRLPRGESIVHPRSRCPSCGTPIRPWDNVPVLSWVLLRGRCRDCRSRISPRYPVVEAATAGLCVLVVFAEGLTVGAAMGVVMVLLLVPLTIIDIERQILPNKITGTGCVLALVLGTALDPSGEPSRLVYGVAASGAFLLLGLLWKGGMGMGDVKLTLMLGLFLGENVLPAVFVALLSGSVVGLALTALKGPGKRRKTKVPFGPFLALGGIVGLLAGPEIIAWYATHFLGR